MTRKRFIKLLMADNWPRNNARAFAKMARTTLPVATQALFARAAADVACVAHAMANPGAGGGKA